MSNMSLTYEPDALEQWKNKKTLMRASPNYYRHNPSPSAFLDDPRWSTGSPSNAIALPSKSSPSSYRVFTENSSSIIPFRYFDGKDDLPLLRSQLKQNHLTREISPNRVEDEVDYLTQLMIDGIKSSTDPDYIGMCYRCSKSINGEGTGCLAMGQMHHIRCFVCISCNNQLRGSPFYAHNNRAYCEHCYMNTLEKCSSCNQAITDRIINADGKPYHSQCFKCHQCRRCLDGIPFTKDNLNQEYCIECFHDKYAPRCSACKQAITPKEGEVETVRVVALDRNYHVRCYRCEDCLAPLSQGRELFGCYPHSGSILCQSCYSKRIR